MFIREPNPCLCLRCGSRFFPAQPVTPGGIHQRIRLTIGVRYLSGEGDSGTTPLQRLLRIAKMPQSMGDKTEATHDRVMSVQKGRSAVFLALVQGYAPLQVGTGSGQLSQAEKRESQRPVGLDEPGRVLPALGQVEQLLSQFVCRLVLGPRDMKAPQPSQHGEDLRR